MYSNHITGLYKPCLLILLKDKRGIFTEQMCIKIWHYSLIGEAYIL